MACESNDFFRPICFYLSFTILINIYSMENEVRISYISMERKICRLHCGKKGIRLYNLINHNINLGDPWLRTHNSFQTC